MLLHFAGNFRRVCPTFESGGPCAPRERKQVLSAAADEEILCLSESVLCLKTKCTHDDVYIAFVRRGAAAPYQIKEAANVAETNKINVRVKGYDHTLVDATSAKVVEAAKANGAEVSGPIPLPTEKEIITILRSTHINKDSREQFEQRTHKRLIVIANSSKKVVDALMKIELPAGVDIEVKI